MVNVPARFDPQYGYDVSWHEFTPDTYDGVTESSHHYYGGFCTFRLTSVEWVGDVNGNYSQPGPSCDERMTYSG